MSVAQVGGDHYKAGLQHWDIIEFADIAYLEATATKYIVRFDRKGTPKQDLLKAISYLERLLVSRVRARRLMELPQLQAFCEANNCDMIKSHLLTLILVQGQEADLREAIGMMFMMSEALK